MNAATAPDARTLTFRLGDEHLGVAAALVREVVPLPRLTRVPHAPRALLGVANIRGTVVPVLSVARLLGRAEAATARVIVAEADGPIGLAVSAVSGFADDDAAIPRIEIASLVASAVPERRAPRSPGAIAASFAHASETQSDGVALVVFSAGGQNFALPIGSVEEVLPLPPEIARLPQADAVALGSIASRGAVLPLLSLAALLGLPGGSAGRRERIIVVRIGTHRVGIVVEAMGGIETVPEGHVDPVPQVLNRGGGEARICAICRLEGGRRLLSVLAPDQLVSEVMTARLMRGEAEDKGEVIRNAKIERGERFLLFRIGGDSFGLPILAVQEVTPLPSRLTPLPKAPAFVQGLMNARGQVIPVIDQARRFNGEPVTGEKARVIVVQIGDLTAGFVVDAVSDIVEVPENALRPAPDLGEPGTRVFDRVASLDEEESLVLIVSPQELLDRAERDLLLTLGQKAAKTEA
ncbi:chemotaxis protein CheW [Novosphingobium soli]|uniref:Chemotaxis protein CheW n=1 Tax=Novosphingobium soli TaxID=574956 RepID=A0ABV6CQ27_9SPHN